MMVTTLNISEYAKARSFTIGCYSNPVNQKAENACRMSYKHENDSDVRQTYLA